MMESCVVVEKVHTSTHIRKPSVCAECMHACMQLCVEHACCSLLMFNQEPHVTIQPRVCNRVPASTDAMRTTPATQGWSVACPPGDTTIRYVMANSLPVCMMCANIKDKQANRTHFKVRKSRMELTTPLLHRRLLRLLHRAGQVSAALSDCRGSVLKASSGKMQGCSCFGPLIDLGPCLWRQHQAKGAACASEQQQQPLPVYSFL